MRNDDLVSVVMPAYNAASYIRSAIESILNQTFKNFEFIIINDGSSDETEEIILSYSDPRIRYISNKINIGLTKTLNIGISVSRGKFIARMDSDDISDYKRLHYQVNFLNDNPDFDLVGTNIWIIDSFGKNIKLGNTIIDYFELSWKIFFRNCYSHPTIMFRSDFLNIHSLKYGFIPDWLTSILPDGILGIGDEDYLLFGIMSILGRAGNIDRPLLHYRIHDLSLSAINYEVQRHATLSIGYLLMLLYMKHKSNYSSKQLISLSTEVLADKIFNQICLDNQNIDYINFKNKFYFYYFLNYKLKKYPHAPLVYIYFFMRNIITCIKEYRYFLNFLRR